MCYGRAAQHCLEMHPDYADFTPGDASLCEDDDPHETTFTILKSPPAANFVALIDTSCFSQSCARITRMKQAAMRLV